MDRNEILEFLSNFENFATIEKIGASDWWSSYEQLQPYAYADFSFQHDGRNYIFRVIANIPMEQLYYSIYDGENKAIILWQRLIEFEYNLAIAKELLNAQIYFYENKLYYKNLE